MGSGWEFKVYVSEGIFLEEIFDEEMDVEDWDYVLDFLDLSGIFWDDFFDDEDFIDEDIMDENYGFKDIFWEILFVFKNKKFRGRKRYLKIIFVKKSVVVNNNFNMIKKKV